MQSKLTKILKAVADPTRRDIFHALVVGAVAIPITQISSQFNMTRQGVTKHIKTLEQAGLVRISANGRERYCLADPQTLQEAQQWFQFYDQFWDTSLGNLERYLEKDS